MSQCLAYVILWLWLCIGAKIESTPETCEECAVKKSKKQLLQRNEALTKEWVDDAEGEEEHEEGSVEDAQQEEEEEEGDDYQLEIGKHDFKEGDDIDKCVNNRKGWYCPEESGNAEHRLNDEKKPYTDTFKIFWDAVKGQTCARRTDGDHPGWGMKLKIQCQKTGKMKSVKIGSNKEGKESKCVEETRGVICDLDAGNKHRRLKDKKYDDEFEIIVSNKDVCASRKDNSISWALDLKIKCAKDAEVIRPLSNMESCITVSEGKLMSEQGLVLQECTRLATLSQFFFYDESTKQIKLLNSPGLCLNGKGEKGTPIKTLGCGDGDTDKWLLQDNKIKLETSQTMCMGVEQQAQMRAGEAHQALILKDCSEIETSFHVTGKEKMDCPWKTPNEHDFHPTCENGRTNKFHCVRDKQGQRIKCPKKWPKMCNDQDCGDGKDFCCNTKCDDDGGERDCKSHPFMNFVA